MGPRSSGPETMLTAFEEHLQSCEQCQAVVAEFEPVVQSLKFAAPAAEPPADLEARTIAAVHYAVMAESQPALRLHQRWPPPRPSRSRARRAKQAAGGTSTGPTLCFPWSPRWAPLR